jgi:Kef-type K+ transport system membrane component KefB
MNIYYVAAIWLGMALLASVVSIRVAVPAALVEIVVGALAGNIPGLREHVSQTDVVVFLASVGSLVLTFLAGAEIDPVSLRGHWKASLSIGLASFLLPFLAAFGFCGLVLGWNLHAAEIGGIALSTTSVAVVYAVMVETGLNRHDLGKLILAACFITDLGTVLALGGLFATYGWLLVVFVVVSAVALVVLPRLVRLAITHFGHRAHLRLHRRAVRPYPQPDRQDPVHRAGHRRHPVRVRADPDRPAAVPARGPGYRGRGGTRRGRPLDRAPREPWRAARR